ncbi:MAG: transposase [bacterium LCO1.1]|uniref:Transposase n=1 Tax=Candidatus Weimeria bifida TaxID=2599074 RepID=A0A6N7J2A4_9FIRM|nr:transposase [Candidatus Weimeria bifida]
MIHTMNPKSLREPGIIQTRTGHYPERVLADQIYRTRENRKFCKENGIRLSGPKLGRPSKELSAEESTLNIKTIQTGSKWKGASASARDATVWDS